MENCRGKEKILQGPDSGFSCTTVYREDLKSHTPLESVYSPYCQHLSISLNTNIFSSSCLKQPISNSRGPYSPQIFYWDHNPTASARPGNTLQTSSRLLSLPSPSHSIPQKQPACAHNYFYLLPKPRTTLCEAFNTYYRGEEVSLVQPPKPPDVHTTAYGLQACTLWQEGGRIPQQQKTCQSPHHTVYGLLLERMQNHPAMAPHFDLELAWTSWRPSGSSCSRAWWSQPSWVSPYPSCSTTHRERLVSLSGKCHSASALHAAKNILLRVDTCRELTHPKEGTTSWGNALVPHRGCSSLQPSQTNIKITCS